ncbi:MAG TPA: hypothetical protein VGK99_03900 [Acidobacteriota bacterium]
MISAAPGAFTLACLLSAILIWLFLRHVYGERLRNAQELNAIYREKLGMTSKDEADITDYLKQRFEDIESRLPRNLTEDQTHILIAELSKFKYEGRLVLIHPSYLAFDAAHYCDQFATVFDLATWNIIRGRNGDIREKEFDDHPISVIGNDVVYKGTVSAISKALHAANLDHFLNASVSTTPTLIIGKPKAHLASKRDQ